MSCVNLRHAKANNKYMKDFDPKKESVCLGYHDSNNFYSSAMSQRLQKSDFCWAYELEYDYIDWENISTK